jgi:hypothetical protein
MDAPEVRSSTSSSPEFEFWPLYPNPAASPSCADELFAGGVLLSLPILPPKPESRNKGNGISQCVPITEPEPEPQLGEASLLATVAPPTASMTSPASPTASGGGGSKRWTDIFSKKPAPGARCHHRVAAQITLSLLWWATAPCGPTRSCSEQRMRPAAWTSSPKPSLHGCARRPQFNRATAWAPSRLRTSSTVQQSHGMGADPVLDQYLLLGQYLLPFYYVLLLHALSSLRFVKLSSVFAMIKLKCWKRFWLFGGVECISISETFFIVS